MKIKQYKGLKAVKHVQEVRDEHVMQELKALVEQVEEFAPEEALVNAEIRITLDNFIQQLQQRGMDFAGWLKATGRTEEQVKAELRPQAVATLKARMALEEICRLENITVSDAEIDNAYADVSAKYGVSVEQLRATFGADNDEKLPKDICMKKAISFLEANAELITE